MMLELRNVSFAYPTFEKRGPETLVAANLNIASGEMLGVLGESGSGKTTLLNLLSGVLSPTTGSIERQRAVVSYLLQDDLMIPFRTVWQNSFLAVELQKCLSEPVFTEGRALLTLARLDSFLDRLPSELSGGMRRRVALIRQLLRRSNVMLLDEPFSAQDRLMRQILEDVVFRHCRDQRKAAVVVTHDIDGAVAISDRIVILDAKKQLKQAWTCPAGLAELRPSERRTHADFADHVAQTWRKFWEATDYAQ